jgi:hypothetical protein
MAIAFPVPGPFRKWRNPVPGLACLCGNARMFVGRGFSHGINAAEQVRL